MDSRRGRFKREDDQVQKTIPESTIKEEESEVTQPQRRLYGLRNQGATCYLNSVLQVLFMTPEIQNRLDPKSQITDRELRNIFETLKETTCGTEKLTKILEIKDVKQERDAAECLEMILHKVSPRVSKVFQGELMDKTKCSKGHSIIEETNPFWILPLSLKDTHETTYSVEDGFKKIFEPKSFSGDNMVYCNKCKKKTEATSGCEMVKSPQILILLLKRFDFDYNTMSHVKSGCCVDVPCVLETKNKKFKLYGMVNHMGSLRGGHYTATLLSKVDKTWYEFDDSVVKKAEEQPVAKKTYNSSAAYLLVYRGRNARGKMLKRDLKEKIKVKAPKKKTQKSHKDADTSCIHKRNVSERNTDDEENTQMGQSEEDEGQMRIVQENTNIKSEESEVDDAAINVGANSCEQLQDKETKTEQPKQRVTEHQETAEINSEDWTDQATLV